MCENLICTKGIIIFLVHNNSGANKCTFPFIATYNKIPFMNNVQLNYPQLESGYIVRIETNIQEGTFLRME